MDSDSFLASNTLTGRVRVAVERSQVAAVAAKTARAASESAMARAGERLGVLTRQSALFRWLTAEPEPDVIVIDLRETWTVGPVISALDWVVAALTPAMRKSGIIEFLTAAEAAVTRAPLRMVGLAIATALTAQLATDALTGSLTETGFVATGFVASLALAASRVTLSWQELADTKIGKAIAAAFEPPEYDDCD